MNRLSYHKSHGGMSALQHIRVYSCHVDETVVKTGLSGLSLCHVCNTFRRKHFSHQFLVTEPSQAFNLNFGTLSAFKDRLT